jgi:hypothetical protein
MNFWLTLCSTCHDSIALVSVCGPHTLGAESWPLQGQQCLDAVVAALSQALFQQFCCSLLHAQT